MEQDNGFNEMHLRQESTGAIQALRQIGHKISNILSIHGNANSTAYKISTERDDFFLKIYPSEGNKYVQTTRFTREIGFLTYLNEAKIANIPKIIYKSLLRKFLIFSFFKFDNSPKIKLLKKRFFDTGLTA